MNFGAKLCGEVQLQRRHFGVTLHPINRTHMASLLVSRLLCLFIYIDFGVWHVILSIGDNELSYAHWSDRLARCQIIAILVREQWIGSAWTQASDQLANFACPILAYVAYETKKRDTCHPHLGNSPIVSKETVALFHLKQWNCYKQWNSWQLWNSGTCFLTNKTGRLLHM